MFKKTIVSMFGLAAVFLLYVYFIEPRWIQEKTIRIDNKKIPSAFSGTKLVFVSDIHFGTLFDRERTTALVERINKLQPDIILLGGDYVSGSNTKVWNKTGDDSLITCFEELGKLKAISGIFGVLGNHDHWQNAGLARKCMAGAGIELIENKGVWITKGKDRIRLGGVGDYWEGKQDLGPVLKVATTKDFVLLVSHNPDYLENIEAKAIDLMFSGHTHGGQMSLFGLWEPLVPSQYGQKYRTGVINKGITTLVVSNGAGLIKPAVRFFARPQIIIVELEKS